MSALTGPVLNSAEAAKYCGFAGGGRSMRNLKARGAGPRHFRVGRSLVFYPADLDAWIQKRSAEATPAKKKPAGATAGRDKN